MNRAERRKAGITAKPRTYVLTDVEIQRIKEEIKKEIEAEVEQRAVDKAFIMLLGIPVLVIRNQHNFGKIRIIRFVESMMGWYESICSGDVTMKEVVDVLHEEADMDIITTAERILVETRAKKDKKGK
jgi:hypothetical protein